MKTRRGKPRDPVKEQFWRRAIDDQARSDLPIQAYCRRKGLNSRSFCSWRQELARRDAEVASTRPGQCPASSTELARASAFLPVRVVEDVAGEQRRGRLEHEAEEDEDSRVSRDDR